MLVVGTDVVFQRRVKMVETDPDDGNLAQNPADIRATGLKLWWMPRAESHPRWKKRLNSNLVDSIRSDEIAPELWLDALTPALSHRER